MSSRGSNTIPGPPPDEPRFLPPPVNRAGSKANLMSSADLLSSIKAPSSTNTNSNSQSTTREPSNSISVMNISIEPASRNSQSSNNVSRQSFPNMNSLQASLLLASTRNVQVIWEGYLRKKVPKGPIKVWQKRYFKLLPDVLQYSKEKGDTENLGTIPIHTIKRVVQMLEKKKGARFDIIINAGNDGEAIFSLLADSGEDSEKLVNSLNNMVAQEREGNTSQDSADVEVKNNHARRKTGGPNSGTDSLSIGGSGGKGKAAWGKYKTMTAASLKAAMADMQHSGGSSQIGDIENSTNSTTYVASQTIKDHAPSNLSTLFKQFTSTGASTTANGITVSANTSRRGSLNQAEHERQLRHRTQPGGISSPPKDIQYNFNTDQNNIDINSQSGSGSLRNGNTEIPANVEPTNSTIIKELLSSCLGKVLLIKDGYTGNPYFMHLINKGNPNYVRTLQLFSDMSNNEHPYIIKFITTSESLDYTYTLYTYPKDRSLLHHLIRLRRFPESSVKIFASTIWLALEYLHSQNTIFKRLNAETVYVDRTGFGTMCDLFISADRETQDLLYKQNPELFPLEYKSPEALLGKTESFSADIWRFGVLLYQLAVGFVPFRVSLNEAKQLNPELNEQTELTKIITNFQSSSLKFPSFVSKELRELIKSCLINEPNKRISSMNIRQHGWFNLIQWNKLLDREQSTSQWIIAELQNETRNAAMQQLNESKLLLTVLEARYLRTDDLKSIAKTSACFISVKVAGRSENTEKSTTNQWNKMWAFDLNSNCFSDKSDSEIVVRVMEQEAKSHYPATIGTISIPLLMVLGRLSNSAENTGWFNVIGRDGLSRGELLLTIEIMKKDPQEALTIQSNKTFKELFGSNWFNYDYEFDSKEATVLRLPEPEIAPPKLISEVVRPKSHTVTAASSPVHALNPSNKDNKDANNLSNSTPVIGGFNPPPLLSSVLAAKNTGSAIVSFPKNVTVPVTDATPIITTRTVSNPSASTINHTNNTSPTSPNDPITPPPLLSMKTARPSIIEEPPKLKLIKAPVLLTQSSSNSKRKIRFTEEGFNLDLSYISPRLICVSSDNTNLDLHKFFRHFHDENYEIYNVCNEISLSSTPFSEKVKDFPFEEHNVPEFRKLLEFCDSVHKFLLTSDDNVVAVYGKQGRGRCGLLISCYLLYSNFVSSADQAILFFARHRLGNNKGITIPSQRRYILYWEEYLKRYHNNDLNPSLFDFMGPNYTLTNIRMTSVPVLQNITGSAKGDPYFKILRPSGEVLFDYKRSRNSQYRLTTRSNNTLDYRCCIPLFGDFRLIFVGYDQYMSDANLCWFNFHTQFINPEALYIKLKKDEIDGACKDKANTLFSDRFQIELYFQPGNSAWSELEIEEEEDLAVVI